MIALISASWVGSYGEICADGTDDDRGRLCIEAGHLEEAVPLFQAVLRTEIKNSEFQKEFDALQLAVKLRKELPKEKNIIQWNINAECLRRYYLKYHVYSAHVDLTLEIYRRNETNMNAVNVIDAFIRAKRYQEALDFANFQKRADLVLPLRIEKAYIYCAAGQPEQARQIVRSILIDKLNSPDTLLRLAKIQSVTHQYASAVKSLKRSFELTPSNILPTIKREVKEYSEFKPILSSSEFAEVMATRSVLPSGNMECAKKWVGTVIDERPKYLRNVSKGNINFDDWRLY